MLAANNIWHWWIGVLLSFAAALLIVGLILGYLKTVVRPQYPSKNQRAE